MTTIEMKAFNKAAYDTIDFDVTALEAVAAAETPTIDLTREPDNAESCFDRGLIYSAGAGVAVDLVEAHKWFNIAAMRGHCHAAGLRREIAEQMADAEIGRAQRAARDWLKSHPDVPAVPARAAA